MLCRSWSCKFSNHSAQNISQRKQIPRTSLVIKLEANKGSNRTIRSFSRVLEVPAMLQDAAASSLSLRPHETRWLKQERAVWQIRKPADHWLWKSMVDQLYRCMKLKRLPRFFLAEATKEGVLSKRWMEITSPVLLIQGNVFKFSDSDFNPEGVSEGDWDDITILLFVVITKRWVWSEWVSDLDSIFWMVSGDIVVVGIWKNAVKNHFP